ncbi:DNA repair protein RadA/Sms [Knoellia remsis]|uniref:DNA repair protein RadA n=1 Tax=Knoellia remsis TaxID=407159 RepID=A0A2T0ULG2_9MICO|nr:DNA repair protein RadA [Knoellia remsis]PRY58779.1 DNA repair protein RadA/Sms [Knoellia remsis]
MAAKRDRPAYRCTECGWTTVKWVGRCGECQAWGSVTEVGAVAARTTAAKSVERPAVPIGEVDASRAQAQGTGVPEFDRVLGGGLVPGAVVLVAGEPGIGKSTLLLDVAGRAARGGAPGQERRVLYVSGEESAAQVRSRAERIEAMARTLFLASETDLATVLGQIEQVQPDLLVVDSVQTISSAEVEGAAGNVAQVREVAASLISAAKSRGIATLIVGHVTKDGSIAGPRVLEHLVDVVVQFEGDRHSRLRLVRAVKNRYGPTDEVGCFDLSDVGITGLADPSGLFLSNRTAAVPGTCVTVTLEGRRPLVTEVQALVDPTEMPSPRRATSGLDSARVGMILAVLGTCARAPLGRKDVFASTVGGVRITEPAADLALALAFASAINDSPLPTGTIAFGEVGLAGELRPVTGAHRRLAEASRLGFTSAIVPRGVVGGGPIPDGLRVTEVATVLEAAQLAAVPAR